MLQEQTIAHEVVARNLSAASENRIHDNAVAQRFGFSGGLVPGVEVYAYMLNPVVRQFGIDWLARGSADIRLLKPVYDGRPVVVTASQADSSALALTVESDNVLCATGTASTEGGILDYSPTEFVDAPLPDPAQRPEATPESLPDGRVLGTFEQDMDPAEQEQYLNDIGEPLEVFRTEKIIHPGWLLRMANRALSANVQLGPWMHVGSTVRNLALARHGDRLSTRSRVRRSYEHKGHLFVDIAVLILHDETAIQFVDHVSIYRPRQVSEVA